MNGVANGSRQQKAGGGKKLDPVGGGKGYQPAWEPRNLPVYGCKDFF
jgi:hypothetical protein